MSLQAGAPATRRRITPALLFSLALWSAYVTGIVLVVRGHSPGASRVASKAAPTVFNHIYPPDPAPFERPAVGTVSPLVAPADRVQTGRSLSSLPALARSVAPGIVVETAPGHWEIRRPVELTTGTSLVLQGPLVVDLMPGAFVLAEHGALLKLSNVTVRAVRIDDKPEASPLVTRGFLDARDGARLVLRGDRFFHLGHLGDQAYGVTLDGASAHSEMVDCSVVGDYFGIYLAKMTGGRVVANRFLHSVIYGIDPHTYDSNLLIYGNRVAESGVHGIVLADHASRNRVIGNTILASKDHGIVIYQYSDGNIVERNRIRNTFDGIVVQDGSRNLVAKNVVGPVDRFALRISGLSYDNVVRDNTLGRAIVGAYLYQGPTGNRLLFNRFRRDYENVRIRVDAPGNTVRPWPQRSEIPR